MDYFEIQGGLPLTGEVEISGAKNAALPLIASTIISNNSLNIGNIPDVSDIKTLLKLLENLGASYKLEGDKLSIDATKVSEVKATYDIVKTMRASVLVLGPLLGRFGSCEVSLPGGCAIGERPIDLHLKALEQMGANINIKGGYVEAVAPNGLKGAVVNFDKTTVTGTENIVMAAALADGVTKIINAAKEPEVVQLCEVLKDASLDIKGIGTDILTIVGTNGKLLDFKDFDVIPDRIEAGTYLCAGAITNSHIKVTNIIPKHLFAFTSKLGEMGFDIKVQKTSIEIFSSKNIKPVDITTSEYPGFPTDMQAQLMAVALKAKGTSIFNETLFENRFMHVGEFRRLGANISITSHTANIDGGHELIGADVMATDLRASSALVLAGLASKGVTNVHRIYHIDRGYQNIEKKLSALGAKIKRLKEK
jgi:UDP-N-acetylglucosamine 1-carboxyvinyltransferase